MDYRPDKAQKAPADGRMRIQCTIKPEIYSKLVAISGDATLADTMTRLIVEEYARTQTPAIIMQRKAQSTADDAVHRSVMAALQGASRQ